VIFVLFVFFVIFVIFVFFVIFLLFVVCLAPGASVHESAIGNLESGIGIRPLAAYGACRGFSLPHPRCSA